MTDAFISYSRRDKAFVQRLFQELEKSSKQVWVDWEDIPLTADWWKEIEEGIEEADAFICVISPDYVRSDVCYREIEHAVKNFKRFVPILYREVTEKSDCDRIHPMISSHNWVYMREADNFAAAVKGLTVALDTDLTHVKNHTRLLNRALTWEKSNCDESRLLKGTELDEAERWLAAAPRKNPEVSRLHSDYIFASRKRATLVQRRLFTGVSAALLVTVLLMVLSFFLFQRSETNLALANVRGTEVRLQEATAVRSAAEARSFGLSVAAESAESSNQPLSVALALESVRIADPAPQVEFTLAEAAYAPGARRHFIAHTDWVQAVDFLPDGQTALSGSDDGTLILWNLESGDIVRRIGGHGEGNWIYALDVAPDGKTALSASADATLKQWNLATGQEIITLNGHEGGVRDVEYSPDGNSAASAGEDTWVIVWNLEDGEVERTLEGHSDWVRALTYSPDGKRIASGSCADYRLDESRCARGEIFVWDAQTGEKLLG
ncbi:MAG: TIR domain-containing protein, partial [Anaerolineae bacterium]|nr:TIR domain-containing protein [Anaerolineae bacterium]